MFKLLPPPTAMHMELRLGQVATGLVALFNSAKRG